MSEKVDAEFIKRSDEWLREEGPGRHAVISSRARYARNLGLVPFAPCASDDQLRQVAERIDEAVAAHPYFAGFRRIGIKETNSLHRRYLKESHLISAELEQGGEHRVVYISPDYHVCLMVNEEDHLRMQCLQTGFQLPKALAFMDEAEARLSESLPFARHPRFGYLTACPTNVGTGLRLSVMLHLPGLVLIRKIGEIVQSVGQYGLTVRGIHGEGSEHVGDFYQISNEVTLGKTQEEIRAILETVAEQIVQREVAARNALFEQQPVIARDLIGRAFAILRNASIIDSGEALTHLSKMRLGIDHGFFQPPLSHTELSRLMIEVQPAHLQFRQGGPLSEEKRDNLRAQLLRQRLQNISYN
jgi:protein arginine kinase